MTLPEKQPGPVDRRIVAGCLLVAVIAGVFVADSIRRIALRMRFDYDLLLWGDDYFMTSVLKLAAGAPVYGPIAEANSTVYAPGGPYLHHAVLAPLGLETSLLANRILNQCWLALAIALSTAAVVRLSAEQRVLEALPRLKRAGLVMLAVFVVALAALVNPVIDSLHPTNLELCVLGGTTLALARWDELSVKGRAAASLALPCLALIFKQTAVVPVTAALAIALWSESGSASSRPPRWPGLLGLRLLRASLPPAAAAIGFVALALWTNGGFVTWGVSMLARHPFDWWKVSDIYAGFFLLFVPSLLGALSAIRLRPSGRGRPGLRRVASLTLAYAPFAVAALLKTMGGPNNLAVLGYLITLCALPTVLGALVGTSDSRNGLGPAQAGVEDPRPRRGRAGTTLLQWTALILLGAQVALWYPRRRVPTERDQVLAKLMCDYAAARARCGERVFLGRGAVCLHRGGVEVPTDRMMSIIEATVAGHEDELDFYDRIRDMEYDVLIFWVGDLQWGGQRLWDLMRLRYRPFFVTRGELEGDFWYHGWQGYVTWPVAYWERLDEAGKHALSEAGRRCDGPGSARPLP